MIREEEDYTDTYPLTVEEYETGDTVAENTEWWRPIKNGTYRDYYAEQYGTQLRNQQ